MIDILNAIVVLLNYIIIPGLTYGSQLALGALGVLLFMLFYVLLIFPMVNLCHLEQ